MKSTAEARKVLLFVCLFGLVLTANVVANNPPNQPSNDLPGDGTVIWTLAPILWSSAFSDPDPSDTQASSQWQVRSATGDYATPLFDSGPAGALTHCRVPDGLLSNEQTYFWRVRHQDNQASWSPYSDETAFTVTIGQWGWVQLSDSGPSLRYTAHGYDRQRDRGVVAVGMGEWTTANTDTWEWDSDSWTNTSLSGPVGRTAQRIPYDKARGEMVLFGGSIWATDTYLADTWTYDGVQWTQKIVGGPSARMGHGFAYDSKRAKTILYGGLRYGTYYQDTWEWDGASWAQLSVAGLGNRAGSVMVYDPEQDKIVLFGGKTAHWDADCNDTWTWDGGAWALRANGGPPARAFHAMAYDRIRGHTVIFGGEQALGGTTLQQLGDTWEWDGTAWTQIAATGPHERAGAAMFYDEIRQSIILVGGCYGPSWSHTQTPLGDTWELRGDLPLVNNPPVAMDDAYSVDEDNELWVPPPGVLGNDVDADGDPLRAVLVSDVSNGLLTLDTSGAFLYTPNPNYNGPDSFMYKANDGAVDSNVATVSITVNPVNDPPAAADDGYSVGEDNTLTVPVPGVLGNDSDVDGDMLTAALDSDPINGTVTLNTDGSFVYAPNPNYNGPDSFTYRANDGQADSNVATVSITVNLVNDMPVANAQSVATDEDMAVEIVLSGTDMDGDPLTYSVVTPPSHGTLSGTAPNLTYTPAVNYNGPDSFTFRANDGQADSNVATVAITVNAVNDSPVANDQAVNTLEDTAVGVALTGSDIESDPLTFSIVTGPLNGTLSGTPPDLSYTPGPDFYGTDSLTFQVNDGQANSNIATAIIDIASVNDAPVAVDDAYDVNEDETLTVEIPSVLGNDSDTDDDTLAAVLVAGPSNGTLTLNTDGSFTYAPDADFNGTDSFIYRASDGLLDSADATVTIAVNPVNDAPMAEDDTATIDERVPIDIDVLANDSDVDDDELSVSGVTQPTKGTVTINPDGTVEYTPNPDAFGTDSFSYTVSDGNGGEDTANVTVIYLNHPPTANAGPDVTIHWIAQESTTLHGQVSDPDPNSSLTYRWLDVSGAEPVVLLEWIQTGPAGEADLDLGPLDLFPLLDSTLRLEVSDGDLTASDEMVLTITNAAPTAQAGDNIMIDTEEQNSTVLLGTADDEDGDPLFYRWLDITAADANGDPVVLLDWTDVGPNREAYLDLSQVPLFSIGEHRLCLDVADSFDLEFAVDDMILTISNSPPYATVYGGGTYQLGDTITINGSVSDFDGDLLSWEIIEGDVVHESGQVQAPTEGNPVSIPAVDLTAKLDIGVHEIVLRVSDGTNVVNSDAAVVTVVSDTEPPTLSPEPSITQLWPPNHELVPVTISVNAYDNSEGVIHLDVSVVSDTPVNDTGDGNTEPDWYIDGVEDGPGGFVYLRLRSERPGKGDGRTYTIAIVATDSYGNSSSAQVKIIAPHDKGKK